MATNIISDSKSVRLDYIFSAVLCFLFFLHVAVGLEHTLYINEIFTLIGFVFFIKYFPIFFLRRINKYELSLILYFLWTTLIFVVSPFSSYSGSTYQIFRTFPLYYSFYCFFLGIWLYKTGFFSVIKKQISFSFLGVFFGGKLSPPVLLALASTSCRARLFFLAVLMPIMFVYKYFLSADGNSTLFIISLLSVLIGLFPKTMASCLLLIFRPKLILLLSFIFLFFLHHFFFEYSHLLLGGLSVVEGQDANALWRLAIWTVSLEHLYNTNFLFGIGLGSPIFDIGSAYSDFIVMTNPNDPNFAYTLGLHNSFVSVAVRFGIPGFIFLLFFVVGMVRSGISKYGFFGHGGALMIAVLFINIAALFNVILESPLYAGSYWLLIGICFAKLKWNYE